MSAPLRIVADTSPLKDGRAEAGIGRYVRQLTAELARLVDLHPAAPRRSAPESWARRFLTAQPTVTAAALRWRPHLVHGMASDPELGWPLRRQVVTLHDVAPWTTHAPRAGSATARYLEFQRRRFRRCAAVIAVSEDTASAATSVLQVPEGAVHLVPEGVAHVFLDPAGPDEQQLRRAGGAPKEPYVLWVGSLRAHDPRKRLDDLVAAVASMGADAPPLVLAGRTGDESSRLAEAAARSGVRLVLTGYVADPVLAALYRGAGAVAIPSGHEGFGLTLLEAMGCGAPVVTSSGGNLAALAGDAALVVSPGDREALTDALRVALTQPDVAARLRARGVERAQTFTWRRAAEETVAVYERALGR